jgi:hypothetical protein
VDTSKRKISYWIRRCQEEAKEMEVGGEDGDRGVMPGEWR